MIEFDDDINLSSLQFLKSYRCKRFICYSKTMFEKGIPDFIPLNVEDLTIGCSTRMQNLKGVDSLDGITRYKLLDELTIIGPLKGSVLPLLELPKLNFVTFGDNNALQAVVNDALEAKMHVTDLQNALFDNDLEEYAE
jgi:hypothetical protein